MSRVPRQRQNETRTNVPPPPVQKPAEETQPPAPARMGPVGWFMICLWLAAFLTLLTVEFGGFLWKLVH
jgi:hypothetical protein